MGEFRLYLIVLMARRTLSALSLGLARSLFLPMFLQEV
ncbi:unnamed protein product [Acidithrix sp. C25]|nr:unnamed protein product [Acidithrix sp. C25]